MIDPDVAALLAGEPAPEQTASRYVPDVEATMIATYRATRQGAEATTGRLVSNDRVTAERIRQANDPTAILDEPPEIAVARDVERDRIRARLAEHGLAASDDLIDRILDPTWDLPAVWTPSDPQVAADAYLAARRAEFVDYWVGFAVYEPKSFVSIVI